jgi:S-adenosylmethionine hydrolase
MSDAFGNLITNLSESLLEGEIIEEVRIAGETIRRITRTFGEAQPGDLVALIDSSGRLSVSLVNGSAANALGTGPGEGVEVILRGNPRV